MRERSKPKVNLYVQVPPDVDDLRHRLQAKTGWSAPRLVEVALREFEARLEAAGEVAA
jgi:hypothetical protein